MQRAPFRVRALIIGLIAAGAVTIVQPPGAGAERLTTTKTTCVACDPPTPPAGRAGSVPGIRW